MIPGSLQLAARDIKLSHSIFALPFALLGAFLARDPAEPWTTSAIKLALIVSCMVAARTWAMLVNRLADATLDAANPRTARRAVASGALPRRSALAFALLSAAAFVALTLVFGFAFANWWPAILSVPVLAWLAFYSFAKRFTALCHLLLGSALAISPIAAALAINPHALASTPAIFWLAAMVTVWVAGFDIIYALQDVEYDQSVALFSIPSRLGVPAALWLSRLLHVAAAVFLALAWRADPRFATIFLAAVILVAALLIAEHLILARRGRAGLHMAFFTVNGIVSCVVGGLGVIDVLW